MRLLLEQRYLFDGSVAATARSALHHHHGDDRLSGGERPVGETRGLVADDRDAERRALIQPDTAQVPAPHELLVIDPRVANWQVLADSAGPSVERLVLDPTRDGLTQITQALAGQSGIDAVHILAYGKSGEIDLGSTAVDGAALASHADELASWRSHLTADAQIDLYGCDVGAGQAGTAFVDQLHALTGVGVAASTDATGASSLGGDWTLEARAGVDAVRIPFSQSAIDAYDGVLDRPTPTVTLAAPAATVLLGSTFTETVTFQNTATNGVGYGPFVDVFAPNNAAETATLNSATFLGATLTTTAVTLSTTVAGHVGTLGALHPLAVDSTGAPLFVAAPAGFVAGDKLYVVTLPFGSFTPGQPAAVIDLNFTSANISELTAVHPTSDLNIAAVGGFQFGADPLNDPATDPSLRGTSATEAAGASDAGNGLVATSSPVTLLNFDTTVATNPGENETATGPSFVSQYLVTITPAPATTGDPINNLAVTFTLPDGITYTGGAIGVTGSPGTASFTAGAGPDGGTVSTTFPSIAASGTPTVIDVPIYVPRTYNTGAPVLDPTTGAPVTTASPVSAYSSGTWAPRAGSVDAGTTVTVSGSSPAGTPIFTDKSFALQESVADQTSMVTRPGDELQYTLNFQVSDFYGLGALQLQALLGDGLTVDNTVAPVLTVTENGVTHTVSLGTISEPVKPVVNGQTVSTTGSDADWNYARDNTTTGQTTVNFDAGAALASITGSSTIVGPAATGTLTFNAQILDKYTNTNPDPNTGLPASIAEGDTLTSTSTGHGAVLTTAGVATATPPDQISDNSAANVSVPQGSVSLVIVAVNGAAVTGPVSIKPGDAVTYQSTYNLVSGDFEGLKIDDFLPLPILNVSDPTADGTNAAFTPSVAGTYPASGTYRLINAPAGVGIQSVSASATSNGLTFNFGSHDDPTNAGGQTVVVDFTVKAGNEAEADKLLLTTQAQSDYSNASSVVSKDAIQQLTLTEPNLVLKTGVVSLVSDADAAKGSFTNQVSGAAADPTGVFNKATTAGSPFVGAIPTTIGTLEDLNASGADGADTERVVVAVQNTGTGTGGAFDVTLAGILPTGIAAGSVSNFRITRGDGTVLTFTKPDGTPATAADFFTTTGILVQGAGGSTTPSLFATGDASHRDILYVTYDAPLPAAQLAGATLTGSASIVNYASVAGGVAAGDGFVSGGTPAGGTAASITDTDTVTTTSPALTKSIGASNVPTQDNRDATYPNDTIVIGETRPVTITVTLPEGSLTNGAGDVKVTEALPTGETFAGLSSVTDSAGVTQNGVPGTVATVSGNTITFDLGSSVVNANADGSGTVTIVYDALFPNGANTNGTVLTSTANLIYAGAPVPAATGTVIEHDPAVTETITDNSGGTLYSNQVITYTAKLTNSGVVDADALVANLAIPAGLTYVPGSLTYVSGGTGQTTNDGTANDLQIGLATLAAGGMASFTFQATVDPNQPAGKSLAVASTAAESTYHSVPAVIGAGRTYTVAATDTHAIGQLTPTLVLNATSEAATTGSNVEIGEIAHLRGTVTVPEGATNNVVLTFNLPAGLTFPNDGTTTIALVSPGGDFRSSTLDPAGNTAGLQTTTQNATPTFLVPNNLITVSGNTFSINLGTISNNDGVSTLNQIIVEFNGIVANTAANVTGTTLSETLAVSQASSSTQTSNTVTETVVQPHVTLAKAVTAVNSATDVVTYRVTLTNTGSTTAYGVTLSDPESSNEGPIGNLVAAGSGANVVVSGSGTGTLGATLDLAAGSSETFTYTVTVTDPTQPVPNATATETYRDLVNGTSTLDGTSSGATGTTTGGRDGVTSPLSLNNYKDQATLGLGTASGQVWQALGATPGTFDPAIDTPLAGVTVTARTAGPDGILGNGDDIVETTTTAANGTYFFGLLPSGAFTITLPASGASGLPGAETLVYDPFGNIATLPGTATSTTAGTARTGVNFAYEVPDTAPVLGSLGAGTRTLATGSALNLSATGTTGVTDAELDRLVADNPALYSYAGASLVVQRYLNGTASPNAADSFGGDGTLVLAGGNVVLSGVIVGTYTQAGGVLGVTFASGTTSATAAGVLDHLTYTNNAANAFGLGVTIGATLADGNTNGYQGTGGVKTSAPVLATFDLVPTAGSITPSFIEPNDAAASGAAVAVDAGLVLADSFGAGATLSQATVTLSGNFAPAEDVLAFAATASTGDIAASYAGGTLTLTSASGNATLAQWQAALDAVRYYDSSDVPSTLPRTITIGVTDKATGTLATSPLATLGVTAVNDSPVLDTGVAVALAAATEDSGPPAGAVGTLVSSIAGTALNVTDPDGANSHDGAPLATLGIAIVGADTSLGNWFYSTNGGATWTEFAGAGIATPISAANALHLVGDANTRIFFQPTTANFNGAVPNALSFRAWDQFDPVANGGLSALPVGPLGTGVNTAGSSYSVAVRVLPEGVTAVNDAPIASGTATLAATVEDTASPPGATVASLFGGDFSDAADQQQTGANPTGSVANTLAGIAVTGNTTPAAEGVWRYSLDGGATWVNVSTSLSDSGALVLSASAKLDFLPAANFNGAPPPLTVRLIDSSTDVPVSGAVTGAALAASTQAIAGVDVSGAHNGGATAVSAAAVPLNTAVTAVNDAPIATGTATLAALPEDSTTAPGATVASLFGGDFSDAADQQQSGANPTGSVANTLAAVAITGNTTPTTEGVWRYSLDGGTTWVNLPTTLSDSNALVLSASAKLDFLPVANFNGAPPPLTVRLIDSSTDVPVSGAVTGAALAASTQAIAGVDVSGAHNGGVTAVSAAAVPLNTGVTAVNDAPIASGTATLASTAEDTASPPGATVASLFGADFSDTVDQQQSGANPTGSVANTLAGVAITANTTPAGEGAWRYSLDGGTTWVNLPTTLSDSNALVLSASAKLDFLPVANFNGAPPPLTVRLIDSSTDVPVSGAVTGAALAASTQAIAGVDVSGTHNGGITAISAAAVPLNTAVTAVNDAPIATGSATLAAVSEDTGTAPGATVATLFGADFSDAADQQQSGANPTGSVANTLAGVAITGNATPASEGVWRYSLDGGTSWINLPTTLSDGNALVLSASAKLDFLPAANFNGAPPPLTVRLIDSSTDVPVSGAVTGAALAASTQAIAGVDVSGAHNGGSTAVSAAAVPLNTAVTAVNDAPIATGTATLASTAEDTASPPGATVASLFGADFSDAADQQQSGANPTGSVANTLAAVAITGNTTPTTEGVWRYSLDGGTTWVNLPTALSDSNALVLSASAKLEFLPVVNFNGAPPPLTVRLIDSSTDVPVSGAVTGAALAASTQAIAGVDVSGAHNGGVTAVSAAAVPLNTGVTAVNDAPIASGTATLASTAEDTASPPGATVANLFGADFSDTVDQQQSGANPTGSVANTLAGVAITGNTTPATEGVWRYSLDGGTSWITLPTTLSDGNALVLSASAKLDFLPAANFNGAPPPLTVRLIDSSTDVPVSGAVTGASLAASTQAIAGVDVSGAHNGGITAVSAAAVPLSTAVTAVNDAPVATGAATLAPVAEDVTAAPGATVASLFGGDFSDVADQQQSGANPTGSVANTLAGVAITGNTTPASEGVWRYSLDGGTSWVNLPTTLSDGNALVLSASAKLDFLPAANFNGAPPPLTVRLIDSSTDVPVSGAVTGAALAASTQAIAGVDVSGAHDGGSTAVSAAAVPLATSVTAVNDAPIATGTASLASTAEDTASPPGATVASLFGGNFSDTTDGQQSGANPGGSTANTLAGVAITGNTTPAAEGVWRYSLDGGTTWVNLPTTLSDGNALVLSASAKLDFLPAANFNGAPPPLTARLIDSSTDVPVSGGVTGANLAATTQAIAGVDVSGTHNGGITAVSAAAVPLSTSVTAVNDAPIATGNATLAAVAEDTGTAPGATVASLFGGDFSDTVDQQQSGANPTGSVANTLAGVAITGNATPASEGVWRYSLDGGTTWVNLPTTLSDGNALVLSASAKLDFLPAANFNGAPPPLTVRLIDSSTDVPVSGAVTGAALASTTQAIAGVDVSGAHNGGTTAISAAAVPLSTSVTAVNDAPVASGAATLASTAEDTASPPGATVGSLFGGNFTDAADQQQSGANPTGSVANTLAGVAITGNTTPASEGAWRYSLDGGMTWINLPTTLSDSNALVLSASAKIDFLPAANFNGAPPPLTVRLIDSSADVPITGAVTGAALAATTQAIAGVDVSGTHDGGATAISAAPVQLSTQVTPVNDAPIATGSATLASGTENAASPPTSTVATLFGPVFSDPADNQVSALNPGGSSANGLGGIALTGNASLPSQGTWQYSTDGGKTYIPVPTNLSETNALVLGAQTLLEFVPASNYFGQPGGLSAHLIDTSTDVPVYGATTGAALATAASAQAGVDVSGAHQGGITAISANTAQLNTTVQESAVAALSGQPATLPTVTTGDPAVPETVVALFAPGFTGPAGTPLTGIVVIGDTVSAGQGTYQYSLDGGRTFNTIPTTLSASNALLLPATATLRFEAVPGFTGTPGMLTAYLVGGTASFVAPGLRGTDVAGLSAARVIDVTGLLANPTSPLTGNTVTLSTAILPRQAVGVPIQPSGVPYLTSNPFTDRDRDVVTDTIFRRIVTPGRPEIRFIDAEDWLFGSELRRFTLVQELTVVDVSQGLFYASSQDLRLEYRAQQPGGLPLPDWLTFDPRTLSLSGVPPLGSEGTLEVQIIARDEFGRQATGEVHLRIGRQPQDLLALLRVPATRPVRVPAALRPDARHSIRGGTARLSRPAATPADRPHAPPAQRPAPAGTPHAAAARPGLSAQLNGHAASGRAAAMLALLTGQSPGQTV